jgi:hypothetical protein
MAAALAHLEEIRQLGVGTLDMGNISPSRIRTLATYVSSGKSLHPVRSGVDKAPYCELTPGSPSPPPGQLHWATRLRLRFPTNRTVI